MEVLVHEMKYYGERVYSDLVTTLYQDADYDEIRALSCEAFYELSVTTKLDPNSYFTPAEMKEKQDDIHILRIQNEMVGSVEIHDNIIDHLIVKKKYQHQGYGIKLLQYALMKLQEKHIQDITLYVADLNQGALALYLNQSFKIVNTIVDQWGSN